MESKFPMDFSNFELDITNRCNLGCPRCSRTELIQSYPRYWKDKDLEIHELEKFVQPIMDQIKIFEFKGTLGDPIFNPKFIEWIRWCKQHNKTVFIHTNGQAGPRLWDKLADLITPRDKVVVGIDGMPHDFMRYRINAQWKNIESLANSLAGKVNLVWQYIKFSYNHHEVEDARKLSADMGFNEFMLVNSSRWISDDDWLMPPGSLPKKQMTTPEIHPQCFDRPMHIVSSDGFYFPCAMYIDDRARYKSPWARTFDIRKTTINDVIKSSISTDFFAKLNDESAPNYCRFQCGKCHG